jgi:hypothetical protein
VILATFGSVSLELTAHRFMSVEFRRGHKMLVAAIFSIIGVTFAVFLAFVAMLAWEGLNKAKAAAHAGAAAVLEPYTVSDGLGREHVNQADL